MALAAARDLAVLAGLFVYGLAGARPCPRDLVHVVTFECIAAGQAVLLELLQTPTSATKPHVVLAATHDGELVNLASETFDAYHFGDSIGPDGLIFDHRLQRGPASTRNAIARLRLHRAPETLLTQAVRTTEMLDRQRGTKLVAR